MKPAAQMPVFALFPVATLALAQPGHAADCTVLDAVDTYASQAISPIGATCSSYLTQTSETGIACYWTYPYRGRDAVNFAEALWQRVAQCRPGRRLDPDQRVNHPDSYDLKEWVSGRSTYALSVKDKASLGRTLVFLRYEPRQDRHSP